MRWVHQYAANRNVFNDRLKLFPSMTGSCNLSGREFQTDGPASVNNVVFYAMTGLLSHLLNYWWWFFSTNHNLQHLESLQFLGCPSCHSHVPTSVFLDKLFCRSYNAWTVGYNFFAFLKFLNFVFFTCIRWVGFTSRFSAFLSLLQL